MNTIVKKIILNGTHEFPIASFSRNTYVQESRLVSNAYTTLLSPTTAQIEELRSLAAYTVSGLAIDVNGDVIYRLQEIEARINSIDESLGDDGVMRVSFTMSL